MASKTKIQTNLRRRDKIDRQAAKRQKLKKQIKKLRSEYRQKVVAANYDSPADQTEARKIIALSQKKSRLDRNASPVRHRNRCAVTGRPRGYIRFLGISRYMALKFSHALSGFKKSS